MQNERVAFNLPQPAREILRADDSDLVYYQVLGAARRAAQRRARPSASARGRDARASGEVRLRDDEMRGQDVRVAYTWVKLDLPGAQPSLVQVAETREKRSVLATEIIKGVMLPQFVILPLAVLLVWLALVRGIKPLSELEERIRARKPDDLSPLDDKTVPLEVAPLVSSVNDLLTRLKDSIATQKRFLADAAHQLKTPLAGLRMQADLAQREGFNAEELKQSLKQIGRSSMRATHTVNQLLALARAESSGQTHGAPALRPGRSSRWRRCRTRCRAAMDKRIDLGYDGAAAGRAGRAARGQSDAAQGDDPQPAGQRDQLHALQRRAARRDHGAGAGRSLRPRAGAAGGGLRARHSARPSASWCSSPSTARWATNVDGSGLGLPIVLEIARQHNAEITLEDAHPGHVPPGTRVTVRFVRERAQPRQPSHVAAEPLRPAL